MLSLLDMKVVIIVVLGRRGCGRRDSDWHQCVGLADCRPASRLPHVVVRIIAGRTSVDNFRFTGSVR